MKVAVSAVEPSLDSEIDPRFGRSVHFIIVKPETMEFETLRNPHIGAASGAGISAAQLICNKGVGAIVTGSIGPKAYQVLAAAGVRMLTGVGGRVRDAIERFKAGKLMSAEAVGEGPPRAGSGMGYGRGAGAGQSMGMGRGRGLGPGCARGAGMGMGRGRGAGGGRNAFRDWEAEPWAGPAQEAASQDDIALLKQQAKTLAEELDRIRQRIEQMESK